MSLPARVYRAGSLFGTVDDDQIVFTRSEPDGSSERIWLVDADRSGVLCLTDGTDDNPVVEAP